MPGYRILAQIERGGQGVVYQAVQIATDRKVALKVPVGAPAASSEQLTRFRREARLAAAIDHPNVAVIHTVESAAGRPVHVFEFVPGESLSARLERGAMPIAESLDVARQVAAGVRAAHERGIIHRDLKPANVRITQGGTVKILDFGLARDADEPAHAEAARDDRTLAGAVMGTPRYMSPEQTRGAEVDRRTDIWAWGCLLYECLAGVPAFDGDTPTDLMVAVMSRDPAWSRLPSDTPPAIRALLSRCLEKERSRRPSEISECLTTVAHALQAREWEHPERPLPPPPSGTPTNLGGELTSFIGRRHDLAEVKRLLASTRLLTLTGSGGCGKTRLAIRVARDLLDEGKHPDGVRLVELAALTDGALVAPAVCAAVGVREEPRTPVAATLAAHLEDKAVLLVLDNCEHVLRACAELAGLLLAGCPRLRILATSREPLGVAGETRWRVPSLSVPDGAGGPDSDAARLFADRAAAVDPGFAITEDNAPAIAQVCRRLDGIPLAIELAAARVRVMSVHQIAARLDDRFRLLTGGSRSALPRQRTLAALIDWSCDMLSDPERALLRRLAVFAGGWTLESAAAVSGRGGGGGADEYEVLDLLTGLVDKSLVMADDAPQEKRYRLLESMRQYAAERLLAWSGPESPDEVHDRHAAWFVDYAERAEKHLQGPEQGKWLARLETEHDNLRAALDWLGTRPDGAPAALRLAGALWRFWVTRGHLSEGRRRLADVVARDDPSNPTAARAKALGGAGTIAWGQADYPGATALLNESLRIRRALNDRSGVAASLNHLGLVVADAGQPDVARPMYEESLAIRCAMGDRIGEAAVLNNLGLLEYRAGRLDSARDLHERSLAIKRQTQDRRAIAYSLGNLAYVAIAQGDRGRARDLASECLQIGKETGDQRGMAEAIELLAGLLAADDPARAVRLYAAVDAVRRVIGASPPPQERAEHVRRLAGATVALGNAAFGACWSEGLAMTLDEAIALAMK